MLLCIYNFGEHIRISKRTPFFTPIFGSMHQQGIRQLGAGYQTPYFLSRRISNSHHLQSSKHKITPFWQSEYCQESVCNFNCLSNFQYSGELYLFSASAIDTTDYFRSKLCPKNKQVLIQFLFSRISSYFFLFGIKCKTQKAWMSQLSNKLLWYCNGNFSKVFMNV